MVRQTSAAKHIGMSSYNVYATSRMQLARSPNLNVGHISSSTALADNDASDTQRFDDVAEQTISPPRVVPDYNDDENKQRRATVVEQMAATSASVILSGGYTSIHSMITSDRTDHDADDDGDDNNDNLVEQAQLLSDKVIEERESLINQNPAHQKLSSFDLVRNPRDSTMPEISELATSSSALPSMPTPLQVDVLNYKDFETRCHVVHRTLPGSLVELVASQIFLGIRNSTGLNAMVKTIQQNLMNHDRLRILGDWVVCAGTNVGMSIEHAANLMMHVTFEGMHFIVYCINSRLPLKNGLRKVKQQLSSAWHNNFAKSAASGDQFTTPSLFIDEGIFARDQTSFNNTISGSRSSSIISSRGSKVSNRSRNSNLSSSSAEFLSGQKSSPVIADKNRYVADTVIAPSLLMPGASSSQQLLRNATEESSNNGGSDTSLTLQRDVNVLDRKSLQSLVRDSWKEHFQQNANIQTPCTNKITRILP